MSWQQIERIMSDCLAVLHLGFGIAILVGGAIRFPPPTYAPLLEFTNGFVWPYGLLFLASGGLLFMRPARLWRVRIVGAAIGVAANSVFAALFLVAVVEYPDAGATAWWAYAGYATLSATVGSLIWTHRGVRERDEE